MVSKFRVPVRAQVAIALLALGATVATLSAGGCNGAKGGPNAPAPTPPPPPPPWTVYAYLMGRNAQAFHANAVMTALTTGASSPPPVVVEAAFSTVNLANPPFTTTRRILSVNGIPSTLLDEGVVNMVDPNELAAFATAAHTAVPAAKYCLILEGPGSFPFDGIGADVAAVASTALDLAALDTGLASATTLSGIARFDVIILDAPMTATAEMIAVLSKYALFVVANEAAGTAVSNGFDYGALITTLSSGGNPSAQALAQKVATSLGTVNSNQLVDMSMNATFTPTVTAALDAFASALTADISTTSVAGVTNAVAAIGSCRATSIEIEVHSGRNIVDLAAFAQAIANVNTGVSTTTVTAANNVVGAVTTNVQTGTVKAAYTGAGGLGIYFPHSRKTFNTNYTTTAAALNAAAPHWANFLNQYYTALGTGAVLPLVSSLTAPATIAQGGSYTVTATITPSTFIHDVTLLVTQKQGGQNVVLLEVPLGPPDAKTGAVSFNGNMVFPAASQGTDGPYLFVTARDTLGSSPRLLAVDADMEYTTAASGSPSPTFVGYEKVNQPPTGNLSIGVWNPFDQNSVFGRNDVENTNSNPGVTLTLIPRQVVVDSFGNISALSQVGATNPPALRSTSGTLAMVQNQILAQTPPIPVTIWLVAESLNGDLGVGTVNVSLQ
jgi:hypothetical protein